MHKIMIVDDEIISQDILSNYIRTKLPSYTISGTYQNGAEALEAFKREPADIVLADIRMPIMDGLTLIKELNKLNCNYVPVIISSYGEFDYAKAAMKLGIVHYLLKPLDFHELNDCLNAAAQTLRFKQLAHSSLVMKDDDQELYLMDLLSGQYRDHNTALQDFSALGFPFAYDACTGMYLKITFTKTEGWLYGKDTLFTAISNLIHQLYSPDFQFPLFRKSNSCDYLIINSACRNYRFEELVTQTRLLFCVEIEAESSYLFSSLEELRTGSFNLRPAKTNVSKITHTPEIDDITVVQSNIQKAIAYMEEHYSEDLSREDVAAKVYMSGAYFSRCFKLVTQTTYKDYLIDIRMRRAIDLLKTNAKIADIAQQVGYPGVSRFSINFRHYTSYSPSEYRSKVLKLD